MELLIKRSKMHDYNDYKTNDKNRPSHNELLLLPYPVLALDNKCGIIQMILDSQDVESISQSVGEVPGYLKWRAGVQGHEKKPGKKWS